MTEWTENTWITAGLLAASFITGALSGILAERAGSRFSSGPECAERHRQDIEAAFLLGTYFLLTVRIRGGFGLTALRDFCLSGILLRAAVSDLHSYEIPEGTLSRGIVLWLLWLILGGFSGGLDAQSAFLSGLLSAIVLSGLLLILSLITDRIFGKETLGGGDIKLLFMILLHLGFLRGILCLILSMASGLIFIFLRKKRSIPWAPSIALGAMTSLLLGAYFANGGGLRFPS